MPNASVAASHDPNVQRMTRNDTRAEMNFRVLPLIDVDDGLLRAWKRLADRAIEPNPFHDPRFLLTSAAVRDDARSLQLALVERDSDLLGLMAFTVEKASQRWSVRAISTVGPFLAQLSDLRHPLIDPGNPVKVWETLLVGLRRTRLPGLLQLENFPGDGPLAESLSAALSHLRIPMLERQRDERAHVWRVPGETVPDSRLTFDLAFSSANTRKQRARLLRGLESAVGSPLTIEDLSSDTDAIEQFLDMEARGWKGDTTRGGHALRLIQQDHWFAEVAGAFRADDRLMVLALTDIDHRVLYMTVGFRSGAGIFGGLDTYDEEFADHSAGTFGRIAEWKYAISELGATFFDPNLSSYYTASTRLYPHRRPHVTLLLAHGGLFARLALRGIPAARRARETANAVRRKLRG
jgi:CelD/BcsL family acetyltransferase involved in cellulose biosynthesis